mgnify:CR=1 FL=1
MRLATYGLAEVRDPVKEIVPKVNRNLPDDALPFGCVVTAARLDLCSPCLSFFDSQLLRNVPFRSLLVGVYPALYWLRKLYCDLVKCRLELVVFVSLTSMTPPPVSVESFHFAFAVPALKIRDPRSTVHKQFASALWEASMASILSWLPWSSPS